jgi:hypothetical protein
MLSADCEAKEEITKVKVKKQSLPTNFPVSSDLQKMHNARDISIPDYQDDYLKS